MRKKHIIFALLLILVSANSAHAWFDTSRDYRQPVNLTVNSSTSPNNFQVALNVSYDSNMCITFCDLQFANGSDNTALPFWIESQVNGSWAYVWVKSDQNLSVDGYIVYMYYGNTSSVTSLSNGHATFEFFDDFNGTFLDSTKWANIGQTVSVANGNATVTGTGSETRLLTNGNYSQGISESRYIISAGNDAGVVMRHANASTGASADGYMSRASGADGANTIGTFRITNGGFSNIQMATYTLPSWAVFNIHAVHFNGTFQTQLNRGSRTATVTDTTYTNGSSGFRVNGAGSTAIVDWFFIRTFNRVDGNYSFGAEEQQAVINVSLNRPTDGFINTTVGGATPFNFTITTGSGFIVNATLYNNLSGTFASRGSNTTNLVNATSAIISDTLTENGYIWNILACVNTGTIVCRFANNNFTYYVDGTAPKVSVAQPSGEYNQNTSIPIQFSAIENVSSISQVWYNIDGGANTTISGNTTFGIVAQGNHTFNLFANNTGGLVNFTTKNFSWIGISNYTIKSTSNGNLLNATVTITNGTTEVSRTASNGFVSFRWDELPISSGVNVTWVLTGFATNQSTGNTFTTSTYFNKTLFMTPAGLYMQVFDEKTGEQLRFNVSISNSTLTRTITNQLNLDLGLENLTLGSTTLEPINLSGGYGQRFYFTTITNNSKPNVTAYLLKNSDANDVTFQVTEFDETPIETALVQVYKSINSVNTLVGEAKTDSVGKVTIGMDSSVTYTVIVSKAGFATETFTYKPSSPFFETVILGQEQAIGQSTTFLGLVWKLIPIGSFLEVQNGIGTVLAQISSNDLELFSLNLTYNGTQIFFENRTTATGGVINGTFNLTSSLNLNHTFNFSRDVPPYPKNITAQFIFVRTNTSDTFIFTKTYIIVEDAGFYDRLKNYNSAEPKTKHLIWMIITLFVMGVVAYIFGEIGLGTVIIGELMLSLGYVVNWMGLGPPVIGFFILLYVWKREQR